MSGYDRYKNLAATDKVGFTPYPVYCKDLTGGASYNAGDFDKGCSV